MKGMSTLIKEKLSDSDAQNKFTIVEEAVVED